MEKDAREWIATWWQEAWDDGLWAAPWSKSLDGLSAQQAAWSPAAGRHSIWQIVLHMMFWRDSWLHRVATGEKPLPEQLAKLNFPEIPEVTEEAWADTRRRFLETQTRMAQGLRNYASEADLLTYFLPHDCYHFGQINYLRALLGLKPIE